MPGNVAETRSAERFILDDPLPGTYGPAVVRIVNLSTTGAQVEHPQPLRVGTPGRLAFDVSEVSAAVQGVTMWSRLSRTADQNGKYLYCSGIRVESGNQELAIALNQLYKRGIVRRDHEA